MTADSGDAGAALRELALRLLASRYLPGGRSGQYDPDDLAIIPGQLPSDLPLELPLPPDADIVGSFTGPLRWVVLVAVAPPVQAVFDFYSERLAALGWEPVSFGGLHGGFVTVGSAEGSSETFRQEASGAFLTVDVSGAADQAVDILLELSTDPDDPWHRMAGSRPSSAPIERRRFDAIPELNPPEGAVQRSIRGRAVATGTAATAELWSEEPIDRIAAHYARRLEAAGWRRLGGGAADRAAWSTWGRQGSREPEQGLFSVVRCPDAPDHYLLSIELGVARMPAENENLGVSFWGTDFQRSEE